MFNETPATGQPLTLQQKFVGLFASSTNVLELLVEHTNSLLSLSSEEIVEQSQLKTQIARLEAENAQLKQDLKIKDEHFQKYAEEATYLLDCANTTIIELKAAKQNQINQENLKETFPKSNPMQFSNPKNEFNDQNTPETRKSKRNKTAPERLA